MLGCVVRAIRECIGSDCNCAIVFGQMLVLLEYCQINAFVASD